MIAQAFVPPRDVDALAAHLISPATGIVRRLGLHPAASEVPSYSAYAELADARVLGCCGPVQTPGGSGFTLKDAVTRALFEAVERYCGAFFDRTQALWGKAVNECFLHGDDFPLYTAEQYRRTGWPFSPLTKESQLWWTSATCLHTGETRYVPSTLVYIPYRPEHREECIGPSLSTGMAAGWTFEEACRSGLYEVCERDAFALMWAARYSGPRLLPSPGSQLHKEAEQVLAARGATVSFVDITHDLQVPTAVAVLRQSHPRSAGVAATPIVAIGSAAKPTLHEACRKALAEAVSVEQALTSHLNGPEAEWVPAADFSNVTDWKWHPLVYTRPEMQSQLDFITASTVCKSVAEEAPPAESLASLAGRLKQHFPQLLVVKLTTPELAEIPVHAVKVMAPHAVPLEPDHNYRRQTIPRLLACSSNPNPLPHPFL